MEAELLDAVAAGGRLGDHLHVRLTINQGCDALTDEHVIVDAQQANR
jgi:hypothetical protein